VVHHRQRLALVGEASEYLTGVHPEFYYFEGYIPSNGLALLGQVHGAHAPFAYWPNDLITAEVVITGWSSRGVSRLSPELVRAHGAVESALDQTVRAQSRGITGTQVRFALRAVWHLDQSCSSNFMLFAPDAVTFVPAIPYSWQ
jgi:hypothetical protein